ncbi:MAG TPA: response regulator transcription factor [Bryobacteraceae bacterium]|nr:response regulator transcription factor [Bryobacteraceae bacterium]
MPIRVGLVEDQLHTRMGLAALIGESADLEVCGQYGSMEEALTAIAQDPPDVLLADIGLPGMSGIEGVRRVHQDHPQIPILMLTVHGDDDSVFAAVCAGACGYLLKETEPDRLLACIRELHSGGAPMSPEIARKVVVTFRKLSVPGGEELNLTSRQMRILQLLAEGYSYKSCAADLELSVDTIRFHVRKIYDRLHVHSRSEAVWKAFASGFVRQPGKTKM